MRTQRPKQSRHVRGAVYLVTLITTAAIVSMVFIGVGLRMAQNASNSIVTQMTTTNETLLDATEYTFQVIFDDPIWTSTAQDGKVFPAITPFVKENTVYAGTVVDADTEGFPDPDTTNYRLEISATSNSYTSTAQIEMLATRTAYQEYLDKMNAAHYWSLGEFNNPQLAIDEIGLVDGTYRVPSIAGTGVNSEGGSVPIFNDVGEYVTVPWSETFRSTSGSISLWMRFDGGAKSSSYSMLGMLYSSGGVPALNLSVYNSAIVAYIDDDDFLLIPTAASTSSGAIDPGVWHHIVMTWGGNGLIVYIDGDREARNRFNRDGLSSHAGGSGNQPLHIGSGYYIGSPSTPEDAFNGSVAHVAFFRRQLGEKEVADLADVIPDLTEYTLVEDSWVRVYQD